MTERIEPEDSGYLRLLKQFGEAWEAADVDKLMSMITDDCVYCASVGPEPGTTYAGKAAVRQGFLAMLAFDSGGVSRAGRVFIAGDVGVSEWSYLFRAGPDAEFEIRGCDIFEFRSGRISRKDAFRKSFPEAPQTFIKALISAEQIANKQSRDNNVAAIRNRLQLTIAPRTEMR